MDKFLKTYRVVLLAALVLLLVPLLLASFYNRPIIDDLCQPQPALRAVEAGEGLIGALRAAAQDTLTCYRQWSGLFFSMFLSRIPITVLDYRAGWVSTFAFVLMLLGGVAAAWRAAGRALGVDRRVTDCAALLTLILFLTLLPSIAESVFWFSGGVNYTFMFALSLLLFAGLLRWLGSPKRRVGWLICLCAGFFLLGGGNLTTSVVSLALYGFGALYILCKRRKDWAALLPMVFLLVGFAIAVLAPGNGKRLGESNGYSVVATFFYAFRNTVRFSFGSLRFYATLALFVPVAAAFARQARLRYDHPLLVAGGSFLLLACGFMPPLYGVGNDIPDRLLDIQFFLLCLLCCVNLIYFAGWLRRSIRLRQPDASRRLRRGWMLTACAVLGASLLMNAQIAPLRLKSDVPSVKAVAYLLDGQLRTFAQQYDALVEQAVPGAELTTQIRPWNDLFLGLGLDEDPDVWINRMFADYYGCKSIRYTPE